MHTLLHFQFSLWIPDPRRDTEILQISLHLHRELIKALIKKILVHSDGVIEIQLNLSSPIYDSIPKLRDKENLKQGSPIILRKTNYRQEAKRLMDVMSAERKLTRIMTFEVLGKSYGNDSEGRRFIVVVDLNIAGK